LITGGPDFFFEAGAGQDRLEVGSDQDPCSV